MDKLSELSKPVAQIYYDEHDSSVMRIGWLRSDEPKNPEPLYSQEYVSALLAELEATESRLHEVATTCATVEQRIAELGSSNQAQDDHINQQQDRIDSLEKINAGLGRRLGDAEKRLATPVRLVAYRNSPDMHTKQYYEAIGFNQGIDACSVAVRAAGFTVEGD